MSQRIDTVNVKPAVHLERIRYTRLVAVAGPARKPKYVESPRVPGEAALPPRKGAEHGEPGQSGKNLRRDALCVQQLVIADTGTEEPAQ